MKFKIFRLLCLFAYIGAAGVLIYESCLDGDRSSEHSENVGEGIEDVIGGVGGDQAEDILPTEIQITNTSTSGVVGNGATLNVITLPKESQYISYSYSSSNTKIATIDQKGKIKFLAEGTVTFTATSTTHPDLTDSITYTVQKVDLKDFSISLGAQASNGVYQLVESNSYNISIKATPSNAYYQAKYSSNNSAVTVSSSGRVTAKAETTEAIITVTINGISKTLKVKVNPLPAPVITTKVDVDAQYTSYKNESSTVDLSNEIVVRLGEKVSFKTTLDAGTTAKSILYSSSNSDVLSVTNSGVVTPISTGTATVTVLEEHSNISHSFNLKVVNLIEIDTETPIIVEGLNFDDNVYKIINGTSGSVSLNFIDQSSYTDVTYTSSNELVATVGEDGTIIPKMAGKSTITLSCEDGDVKIEYQITLRVRAKTFATDIPNFLYQVRKGIGHFGAFLVFGIFSTLTFFMWFKPKRWFFTVPVNFLQGFLLAALTEYIQTFVPKRYGAWSDVQLDYFGFLCSAILITIGAVIYIIVKKIKNKA